MKHNDVFFPFGFYYVSKQINFQLWCLCYGKTLLIYNLKLIYLFQVLVNV